MSSAFISYSTKDEKIAKSFYEVTTAVGIKTFLASISIDPGNNWMDEIFKNLNNSDCVFFLASKNSVASAAVQQELGASLIQKKTIVPVLIDVTPEELPGWVVKHQAIYFKNDPEQMKNKILAIAKKIKSDRFWEKIIVGAIVIVPLVLVNRK